MVSNSADNPLLLPERSRLLYIGPPKTGTTGLQEAAASARKTLYKHGVYYPGTARNHRREINSLLKSPDPLIKNIGGKGMKPGASRASASRVPPASIWRKLMDDVDAESSKRIFISHEFASTSSRDEAELFRQELGPDRIHIAITLRPLWACLVSRWIEVLKNGTSAPLGESIESFFDPSGPGYPARTRRYFDHAGVVERWADVVGPENVTVIVADKAHPHILTDTFEQLLGLPANTLTGTVSGGVRTNRSMSRLEAELVREVNARVYDSEKTSWPAYFEVMYLGAINHMLDARVPPPGEPRVELPEWAVERTVDQGNQIADRVAASGVRVVGDLAHLRSRPRTSDKDVPIDPEAMRAIAIEALAGAIQGSMKYEESLLKQVAQGKGEIELPDNRSLPVDNRPVSDVTYRELVSVLAKRGTGRIRRRINGLW